MLAFDNVSRSHFKQFKKAAPDMCIIVYCLQKVHLLGDGRVDEPTNTLDAKLYQGNNNPDTSFLNFNIPKH